MRDGSIEFFGITDVGKKRDHNEDAFYFSGEYGYAVLADGMGGRNFGEVASQMTVDVIRSRFSTFFPESIHSLQRGNVQQCTDMITCLMDDWIRDANFAVWDKGQKEEEFREMGTTLAMVYAMPTAAVVAHIGDSRVYQITAKGMDLVTHDHSFVNSQVATGAMTQEEANASAQKNIITRAIGTGRHVKPEIQSTPFAPGDRLLICSDGLSDMVTDEVIFEIASAQEDPDQILQRLVNEANNNGGRDNITILLVENRHED